MKGGWLAASMQQDHLNGKGEVSLMMLSLSLVRSRPEDRYGVYPGGRGAVGCNPAILAKAVTAAFLCPLMFIPSQNRGHKDTKVLDFLLRLLRPLRVRLKCSGTDGCSDENKLAANKETRPLYRAIFTLIIGI
jgi:hypothetical protein